MWFVNVDLRQVIRQGYLLKRSSNLRGDWQRRFFVLDSRGMLYYYRKGSMLSFKQPSTPQGSPPTANLSGNGSQPVQNSSVQSILQGSLQASEKWIERSL